MIYGTRRLVLGALHGVTLGAALSLFSASAVIAAEAPPVVAAKTAPGSDLSRAFAAPDVRVPVIIRFARPAMPDASAFATPAEADIAETRALHAEQDRILAAAFGSRLGTALAPPDRNLKRFDFFPILAVTASGAEIAALATDPKVLGIEEDRILRASSTPLKDAGQSKADELSRPNLDVSGPRIGMPAAYALGATGLGYHVAVIDSGARRSHEFLKDRVTSAACYSTTSAALGSTSICPGGAASSIAIDSAEDCDPFTISDCGRGTYISGIVAGFNSNRKAGDPAHGIARDGRLISINVFSRFPAASPVCTFGFQDCIASTLSDNMKGLERVYALRNTYEIAAVAWNPHAEFFPLPVCPNPVLEEIVTRLGAAGISVVGGAGDVGDLVDVAFPACLPGVVAVASSLFQDVVAPTSNWGPQVDLVAPGWGIISALPISNETYIPAALSDGAAAHVAGAFAAIRSARPLATPAQIEAALKNTGLPITDTGVTKPRIRVDQALATLPSSTSSIVTAVTPVARAVQVGATATIFATVINVGTNLAVQCSVALPPSVAATFSYQTRDRTTGALGPVNVSVNVPAGARQDFLLAFTPTAGFTINIAPVFDCINTPPATVSVGLNTLLLTAVLGARPADLISTAVTATNDGIMNVPLGGTGFAALAAINIGAGVNLQARLDANAIGGSGGTLAGELTLCQTNPTTGECLAPPSAVVDFPAAPSAIVTFTAFLKNDGSAIPFDPARKRMFVHFYQGATPVGSASVAVRTVTTDQSLAAAD